VRGWGTAGLESHRRSITKAITWRVLGFAVTVGTTWVVTGEAGLAAAVGVVDTLVKIGMFYFHERAWNRSRFGRSQPPEYQI